MDPSIPPEDRARIISNRGYICGGMRRADPVATNASIYLFAEAIMMLMALPVIGGRSAVLIASLLLAPLFVLSVVGAVVWVRKASPTRLVERYRARLVLEGELDPEAHQLLGRACRAISTVYGAEVNRRGLLDEVANDLILPHQYWELASLLRDQSRLRYEQAAAARGLVTPELRAVLDPQRQAIQRSVQIATERVVRLEKYAHQVRAADAALRAQHMLHNNGKYHDLLAQSGDAQAMAHLSAQGAATENSLRESVRHAIETGQTLAVSADRPM